MAGLMIDLILLYVDSTKVKEKKKIIATMYPFKDIASSFVGILPNLIT